jgi:hypothetical protein
VKIRSVFCNGISFFLGGAFHYRPAAQRAPQKKHGPGPRGLRAHAVSTHPQLLFLLFFSDCLLAVWLTHTGAISPGPHCQGRRWRPRPPPASPCSASATHALVPSASQALDITGVLTSDGAQAGRQEMTCGRSIPEDLRLAEEAGMAGVSRGSGGGRS